MLINVYVKTLNNVWINLFYLFIALQLKMLIVRIYVLFSIVNLLITNWCLRFTTRDSQYSGEKLLYDLNLITINTANNSNDSYRFCTMYIVLSSLLSLLKMNEVMYSSMKLERFSLYKKFEKLCEHQSSIMLMKTHTLHYLPQTP